jgi:hypothetical protein
MAMSREKTESESVTVLVERAKRTSVQPALIQNGNGAKQFTKEGALPSSK